MFWAVAILWLALGGFGAWRHLRLSPDPSWGDGFLALLLLLASPLGLLIHRALFRNGW